MSSHHQRDHHHHKHRSTTAHHSSKPSYYTSQELGLASAPTTSGRGGESMVWNYSTDSTNSGRSHKTSSSSYYSIPSPTTSYSYGSTSASSIAHSTSGYAPYSSTPFGDFMESPTSTDLHSPSTPRSYVRSTPTSLGWLPDTKLWKLYKFVVAKGKEPYLELLPEYVCTAETPARVYLDPARHSPPKKNVFPCQFPGGCSGKRIFSRPADLDRHYKNVHASVDQKDSFPCDYGPCARSKEPFTRKDHYRDHLKDFHKEDLGSAKAGKVEKGSAKWQQLQDAWLKERRISYKFWRCARCLGRVKVEEHGWVCGRCGVECERQRIDAREALRRSEEKSSKRRSAAPSGGGSSMAGTSASTSTYPHSQYGYTSSCHVCHSSGWVEDPRTGSLMACYNCQPATSTSVAYSDWGTSHYASGSGYYG